LANPTSAAVGASGVFSTVKARQVKLQDDCSSNNEEDDKSNVSNVKDAVIKNMD
jgi:hypothetical protein